MIRVRVRARVDRPGWQLVYSDPLSGKPRTKSAGTEDRKEAERAASRWEEELNAGKIPSRISWDEFKRRFFDEHIPDKSKWTKLAYRNALARFEEVMGTPKSLAHVTASVLSEFKGKLASQVGSLETVRTYVRHIQSAIAWGKEVGMVTTVPRIRLPRKVGLMGKSRALSAAEFQLLLDAVPKCRPEQEKELTRFLRLLWVLGLRLDEGRRLAWDRGGITVDLDSGKRPRLVFQQAGHKGRRDELTPIPPDAAAWLSETPPAERKGLVAPVFDNGRPIDFYELSRWVSEVGKKSGIKFDDGSHPTAKSLRIAFATRWAMRVRPITLQKMMRHRSITTTLRFYVGLDCDDIGEELWRALAPTVDAAVDEKPKRAKTTSKKSQ